MSLEIILETITGNLRDAYRQLKPGTMLHAYQLMNERRTNAGNAKLRKGFYTADGAIYFLKGKQKIPALAITSGAYNPILKHIDDAFIQLTRKHNYQLSPAEVEQVLAAPDTVEIDLSSLGSPEQDSEFFNYLVIKTKPTKYSHLDKEERKFAERVYGQGSNFVQNMKMLRDNGIRKTRIHFLNARYVRKHAEKGAIARASQLGNFNCDYEFNACFHFLYNPYSLRGVRKETSISLDFLRQVNRGVFLEPAFNRALIQQDRYAPEILSE